MTKPEESTSIVQLKVRLLDISPLICGACCCLHPCRCASCNLQVGMSWEGIHLYYFDIHAVHDGSFELSTQSPDIAFSQFRFRANDRFAYLYDMGDYWEHEVRLEKYLERNPKKTYPVCTGGSGACPPTPPLIKATLPSSRPIPLSLSSVLIRLPSLIRPGRRS